MAAGAARSAEHKQTICQLAFFVVVCVCVYSQQIALLERRNGPTHTHGQYLRTLLDYNDNHVNATHMHMAVAASVLNDWLQCQADLYESVRALSSFAIVY